MDEHNQGELQIDNKGHLKMNFSGSWNFSGQFQKNPSSSTECVLIYDGEKYILERVDGFGRNLKGNKDTSSSPAPPMNLVKAKKLQTSSQDNTQSEKPETGAKLPKREPRKRKRSGKPSRAASSSEDSADEMIKSLTKNLEETVAAEDEIFESASDNDLLDAQISSSSSSDTESSDTESSE